MFWSWHQKMAYWNGRSTVVNICTNICVQEQIVGAQYHLSSSYNIMFWYCIDFFLSWHTGMYTARNSGSICSYVQLSIIIIHKNSQSITHEIISLLMFNVYHPCHAEYWHTGACCWSWWRKIGGGTWYIPHRSLHQVLWGIHTGVAQRYSLSNRY